MRPLAVADANRRPSKSLDGNLAVYCHSPIAIIVDDKHVTRILNSAIKRPNYAALQFIVS